MLKYNFRYEFKLLIRSRWLQVLSLVLFVLVGFSVLNGKDKIEKRERIIADAELEVEKSDAMMLKLIDSVTQGFSVSAPSWTIPTNPIAVGNYHPRIASMKPTSLSFVATGQSDLFTSYVKPTVSGDDFALNFSEMSSPIQLLFGSFDLAFVIVFLLPLLIIAFSYDVFSLEKERGSLRLLAAQPIAIHSWLLQKLSLRFFWISILFLLITTFIVYLTGVDIIDEPLSYFSLLLLALVYMLFWFVMVFLVNLWIGNSSKNAVALIGLWVIFALLIPSVINQMGSTFYPMPSRTLLINEMRVKKIEVSKKQDEILDNFLRDHPEYAINDSSQSRSFYHRYMASQELVKEELSPIVNRFEEQLQKQQILVDRLKWISPALIIQEALNKLAGNSSSDYESFRFQAIAFAETWREHLMPFLYNNRDFTSEDYMNLPKFEMNRIKNKPSTAILPLLTISLFLLGIGFFLSKTGYKRFNIINE